MLRNHAFHSIIALILLPLLFQVSCTGHITGPTPSGIPPAPFTPPTATPVFDPCKVYTTLNLAGNLDSSLEVNSPGGVPIVYDLTNWILPVVLNDYDAVPTPKNDKLYWRDLAIAPAGYYLFQNRSFTTPLDPSPLALPQHTDPVAGLQPTPLPYPSSGTNFAWNQPTVYPAAATVIQSFTDYSGFTRQITFLFYQINDLGSIGFNSPPNNQAAYAWYAFDTSLDSSVEDLSLVGGSFLLEIDPFSVPANDCLHNRGVPSDVYWGDLLYFNPDGSLASEGAVRSSAGQVVQAKPRLYLRTMVTAVAADQPSLVSVNFGTAGLLGHGLRDGITGDPAPASVH